MQLPSSDTYINPTEPRASWGLVINFWMPTSFGRARRRRHELDDIEDWKTTGSLLFFFNLVLASVEVCLAEGAADDDGVAPASFASWRRLFISFKTIPE